MNPYEDILIDGHEMMEQAKGTAREYLIDAIRSIDGHLGEGAALKHPELIVAFMKTCVLDYGATLISQQIRRGLNNVAAATRGL
jgi:hypothetical protein